MQVTPEMLAAAMKEASRLGLFPAQTDAETYLKIWNSMKSCIQAALDKGPK